MLKHKYLLEFDYFTPLAMFFQVITNVWSNNLLWPVLRFLSDLTGEVKPHAIDRTGLFL